jgi:3-hydroxybutyryl-CoA dehydrogenase
LELRLVAVIGAGTQGRDLAFRAAAAGFGTVLEDVLPSNLRHAQDAAAAASVPGLRFACSVEEAVRSADLILDSVPDELESKLEIFSMLDRMAPPRAILLTPTRSLSIADLASCTYREDRCLSFDLGQPDPRGRREVVVTHTQATAADVLAAVLEFWRKLGCLPRLAVDPGAP